MQVSRLLAVVFFLASTTVAAPVANAAANPDPFFSPWSGKDIARNHDGKDKRELKLPKDGNLLPDVRRPTAGQEMEDLKKRADPPAAAPDVVTPPPAAAAAAAPAPAPPPPPPAPIAPAPKVGTAAKEPSESKKMARPSGFKLGGVAVPNHGGVRRRDGHEDGNDNEKRNNHEEGNDNEKRDRRFNPESFPSRKAIHGFSGRARV
ncbi:hypothetical protein TWF481_005494 [Arthrobotrys musiformis]|uniref:Uncharacterized protein n=1 Tax=Arthrobotrys musiformis TaxID=47236 RepID=A0AAV9WDX1_9PEZI